MYIYIFDSTEGSNKKLKLVSLKIFYYSNGQEQFIMHIALTVSRKVRGLKLASRDLALNWQKSGDKQMYNPFSTMCSRVVYYVVGGWLLFRAGRRTESVEGTTITATGAEN